MIFQKPIIVIFTAASILAGFAFFMEVWAQKPLCNAESSPVASRGDIELSSAFGTRVTLEVGDFLFMDIRPYWINLFGLPSNAGEHNDHVAIYMGLSRFVEAADYVPWGMGYLNGVQVSPWLWMNLVYCNFQVGKVPSASSTDKANAVKFALSHLGQTYQHTYPDYEPYHSWHANPDITDPQNPYFRKYYYPNDPYINYWCCSELVWAGYLHQSIELDSTPWLLGHRHYLVTVDDLRNHPDVQLFNYP